MISEGTWSGAKFNGHSRTDWYIIGFWIADDRATFDFIGCKGRTRLPVDLPVKGYIG